MRRGGARRWLHVEVKPMSPALASLRSAGRSGHVSLRSTQPSPVCGGLVDDPAIALHRGADLQLAEVGAVDALGRVVLRVGAAARLARGRRPHREQGLHDRGRCDGLRRRDVAVLPRVQQDRGRRRRVGLALQRHLGRRRRHRRGGRQAPWSSSRSSSTTSCCTRSARRWRARSRVRRGGALPHTRVRSCRSPNAC